jgi:beta-lactamase regulating signal transducer with metallopeptidase domain/ankyrin repeat protein
MSFHLTESFRIVLAASWQSSFVILLILLVRPLMGPRIPARWRYLLWSLVLGRLLIPIAVLPSSPVSLQNLSVVNRPMAQMELIVPSPREVGVSSALSEMTPKLQSPPVAESSVYAPTPRPVPWLSVIAAVWFMGTLVALGLIIGVQVRLRRRLYGESVSPDSDLLDVWTKCRLRVGVKKGPALLMSDEVSSPALVGLLRPILLLPERGRAVFNTEDWENVFVHEPAHYRRADHWTHGLQLIALAVHWFNPFVWLGFRQSRADRELATDEWALQHLGLDKTAGYGDTLLKVLKGFSGNGLSHAAVGILEDRWQLKHRLQRIVGFSPHKLIGSLAGFALLAMVGVVVLTGASVQKPFDVAVTFPLPPQEILIRSIVEDDPVMAGKALNGGAQVNLQTEYIRKGYIDQNTPLFFAAEKGELDLVRLLVERGAKVLPTQSGWNNPVEAAVRNGFPTVAAYLHDHGGGADPLIYAAGTGDLDAINRLTASKLPNLDEAANAAAGCGQVAALTTLLAKGASASNAFQRAAATGCVDSMRYLLGHGVDLKAVGYDALGHSAYNDKTDATAFLLKAGVSPNREKKPADTRFTTIDPPLNQAARADAVGSAKLLLEAGANPDSIVVTDPGYGGAGNTALCDACDMDNVEIVRLLLDHGAGLETVTAGGFTPALRAAYAHAPRCLALLIDRGANVKAWNAKWNCGLLDFATIFNGEDANRKGFEIPTAATLNRSMATVQVLLDHGIDINSTGRSGFSPLSTAIVNGQTAWTELLLRRGANVNSMDQNGGTPLIRAIMSAGMVKEKRYFDVINELLERGANPNLGIDNPTVAKDGLPSPLKAAIGNYATTEDQRKVVAIMLSHGARFPVPAGSDAEKMLLAATKGDADSVAQLLAQGVSPNVADGKGWTPLLSAAALGNDAIFKKLIDAGADVNAHDALGLNPMWFTLGRYPNLDEFHLLMAKGANLNADSNYMFYEPPIYSVIERNDPGFLADLLKHGASPNMLPGDHPNRFEPLELAVMHLMEHFDDPKRRDIVTMLIAAGANRNPKQGGYGDSLLFFPVANNMIEMTKFLLNAGIDPKKDADGGKGLADELERHGNSEMKNLMAPVLAQNGKTAK